MRDARTLEALGLSVVPREHPLSYPGAWPRRSGLLYGNHLLPLHPTTDRPVGEWPVEPRPHPGPGPSVNGPSGPSGHSGHSGGELPVHTCLDAFLARHGHPRTEDRVPLLAIGSNASPAQLRHKLRDNAVVPMTKARVTGIGIGVSAHVSLMGYVSASPFRAKGAPRELFVIWLDADQLRMIDASEGLFTPGGNYQRITLSSSPAQLESGQLPDGVQLYVNRRGVLHNGSPEPRPHGGQRALLASLLSESARLRELFGGTPEEFVARARGDRALCAAGTRLFAEEGWTTPSGLETPG